MVYNAILRQWPEEMYRRFAERGNLFATTIAVLVRLEHYLASTTWS